jgi:hypothetical protein
MTIDSQILKSRNDRSPVILVKLTEAGASGDEFRLVADDACSWLQRDEVFNEQNCGNESSLG